MRQEDREISNEVTDLRTDTRASKSGRLEAGRLTDTSQATAEGTQVVFDTGQHGQSSHALRDIVRGLGNFGLWSMIGWREIKPPYTPSLVAPFLFPLISAVIV